MKVYVAHSSNFDFKSELYNPIRESSLISKHDFFFPHDTDIVFDSKGAIQNVYDVILAEVSFPSTGLGIELGWANDANRKIICIYKKGSKYSSSLKVVSDTFIEYLNSKDMINKVNTAFEGMK
jgi:hypothetical protein